MKCSAMTKRKGALRRCGQRAITCFSGKWYCYYHNPLSPKKFGEGTLTAERVAKGKEQPA